MEIEKTVRYDVELLTTGHDKEQLEKRLHRVKGLAVSPKEIIASCPCTIATNISITASEKLKHYLEQIGARVAVRRHSQASPSPVVRPSNRSSSSEQRHGGVPHSSDGTNGNKHPSFSSQATVMPAVKSPPITLKRTVGELTEDLNNKNWTVRKEAIIELGQIPTNGIIRHLIEALKDDIWRVRLR